MPASISPSLIRERLAGTVMPPQPSHVPMQQLEASWQRAMMQSTQGKLVAAGVLIPIVERESGLTMLLTQRSAELKHHAGQVSFPGGRMEQHDVDVCYTALRETHEEVGIQPSAVSVAGYLDPMPTITGYAVSAIIGLLGSDTETKVDPAEVEYAFEVPLQHLMDQQNDVVVERELFGERYAMPEFHYAGERIWGATAYLILELRKLLIK